MCRIFSGGPGSPSGRKMRVQYVIGHLVMTLRSCLARPIPRLALTLACATMANGAAAQSPDQKRLRYGEHLSQECSTCHRRDGVDNGIPSILGMKVDDFVETFRFYQAGTRTNPAMVSVAQSLDDEQVQALAAFYASLPVTKR